MNKSIKLLGLVFGTLAVLPGSIMYAMNPEYAKQLAERRKRLMQGDAQRQVVQQQAADEQEREIQNQLEFIAAIENEIKAFTRGLGDVQSYEAIFTLLGNIITELEKKINGHSIIGLRASIHAAVVQAVEALRAHMLTIVQAVQNSDPLSSEILVLENASYLQQFEMQLQRIAALLNYQHEGSFLAIDMVTELDEEFAQNLQINEFHNNNFAINNNNNDVISDDDFAMQVQNDKKRKLEVVGAHSGYNITKKQKNDSEEAIQNDNNNIIGLNEPQPEPIVINYRENPDLTFAEEWMKGATHISGINHLSKIYDQYLGMWGNISSDIAQAIGETLYKENKLRYAKGRCRRRYGKFARKPLHDAIRYGFFEIANLLIHAGVDPNLVDQDFELPLNIAIRSCLNKKNRRFSIELVKTLINTGASINPKRQNGNYELCSPLREAVKNEDIEIINLLIDSGAIINLEVASDSLGVDPELIPLHIAVKSENREVAKILLEKGARVNKRDVYGETALHIAAKNNDVRMVELLLKNGAKPNKVNRSDSTALHIAAQSGFFELYHFLIERGANDSLLDLENKTANDYLLARWVGGYSFIFMKARRARRSR
ncbi:ankyrin repeat domain-containing protein [Candidatus Dependentiae bacterium]|nr:ankyrin repeat domain-containing protein [Candidatus Dependentiae bacterium]